MAVGSIPEHLSVTGSYPPGYTNSTVSLRRFSMAVQLAIRCVGREIPAADSDSDVKGAVGHVAIVLESFCQLLKSDHWKTLRGSPDVTTNLLDIIAELRLLLEHSHSRPLLTESLLAHLQDEEASLVSATDEQTWNVSYLVEEENSEAKKRERATKMRNAIRFLQTRYVNFASRYGNDS